MVYPVGKETSDWFSYVRDYLKPSEKDSVDQIERLQDVCDLASTTTSIFSRFGVHKATMTKIGSTADLVSDATAPFSLVAGGIGTAIHVNDGAWGKVTKDAFALSLNAAKTTRFLHSTDFFSLSKDALKGVNSVAWTGIGVLGGWDFVNDVQDAATHRDLAREAVDEAEKDYHNGIVDAINIRSLSNISLVGMAAISLVSIIFASMLAGAAAVLSAVVLALSVTYITFKIASYFFERTATDEFIIARRDA